MAPIRLIQTTKRRRRQTAANLVAAMCAGLVVLCGLVAIAAALNGRTLKDAGAPVSPLTNKTSAAVSTAASTASATQTTSPPVTTTSATATTASATTTSTASGTTAPVSAGDEYFADAAFIGDSRTEGLMLYAGAKTADYMVHTGMSVSTMMSKPVIDAKGNSNTIPKLLAQKSYRKIYIMLGVNELGWVSVDSFIKSYGTRLDEIRKAQPKALIYVQSILPVTAERDAKGDAVNNARIAVYNQRIQTLAREKGAVYLNVSESVRDSSGRLPKEASSDGVHLKPAYCKKWMAYIRQHTVAAA